MKIRRAAGGVKVTHLGDRHQRPPAWLTSNSLMREALSLNEGFAVKFWRGTRGITQPFEEIRVQYGVGRILTGMDVAEFPVLLRGKQALQDTPRKRAKQRAMLS